MDESEARDLARDGALNVKGACEFLGVGRTELYRLMGSGELMFVKHGARRLLLREVLRRYLAAQVIAVRR
jgi:excisionase family DNA binding protein